MFRFTAILNSGVGVFFVLSGFLIYRPFCEANVAGMPVPDLARYLVRRVLRIYPAYLVCLVIWWRFGIVEILGVRGLPQARLAARHVLGPGTARRGRPRGGVDAPDRDDLLRPGPAVRHRGAPRRSGPPARHRRSGAAGRELAATLTLAVVVILAIPWHSPEAHTLVRLMLPWMG